MPDPSRNAYSSAALPLRDADRLAIPMQCRSAQWWGWQLLSPCCTHPAVVVSDALGVVLDFAAFRSWLWNQTLKAGVELLPGHRVRLLHLDSDQAEVGIQGLAGDVDDRLVSVVVDATGARRVLLRQAGVAVDTPEDPLLTGEGERVWLLQGDDRSTAPWRDRLSFMLGSHWIPHGYGWIFPMEDRV